MEPRFEKKEEIAIVLDFLPNGYPFDSRPMHIKTAIAQAIGKVHFTLLELVPKKGIHLTPSEEVYIGEGKRDKIHHISGKLPLERLTHTASSVMESVIREIISKDEQRFMAFFNNAQPLGVRMHQLELLPGLGKKHMWEILEARDEKPFESFEDLKKRVKLMPDPERVIMRRIIKELDGAEKHRIFVDIGNCSN
ncbi:DUF655 domain-containing protein [Candidatus Woesearchaeota archaeon]|nr:DUF655 domain-containing protein [Candidatus Woesearchaeota archaeon]